MQNHPPIEKLEYINGEMREFYGISSAHHPSDNGCTFCRQFGGGRVTRRVIKSDRHYTLFAALGSFVPGYCILVPNQHLGAFAHLGETSITELQPRIQAIRQAIEQGFGLKVVIAEHGDGLGTEAGHGCNCVSHAHWHFIPVRNIGKIFSEYCKAGGLPEVLPGVGQLSRIHGPYLYLDVGTGQHFVWKNVANFARQFARMVCADNHGVGQSYNWRLHPYWENIAQTKNVLSSSDSFWEEPTAP